jgi:hypothetical protein
MIPPLQPVRLRSISRYLKDSDPQVAKLPPEELDRRARELDDQMIEDFDSREDVLREQMMRKGTWGTEEGMTSFPLDRMTLWQEVCSEFLPTTIPESED